MNSFREYESHKLKPGLRPFQNILGFHTVGTGSPGVVSGPPENGPKEKKKKSELQRADNAARITDMW